MSKASRRVRREAAGDARDAGKHAGEGTDGRAPRRATSRALLLAITLALPLLLIGVVEGGLRLFWTGGANPLFDTAAEGGGAYRVASNIIGRRYFPGEARPPAPPHDVFARDKPANGFRVFVMGASTTAGFPFPHNGTFSRVLADALRDVLPGDSVEVVNLGIAATNSYQVLDLVDEVIAEHPDAVLVYAGHNEYYGALGVGSTVRVAGSPALVRFWLRAMRWRTVQLLDRALRAMRRGAAPPSGADPAEASFMESVVADQDIRLGSPRFHAGERQFSDNLGRVLRRLRAAGVPAFVGSLASNVRDQAPFAAIGNEGDDGARAQWNAGQSMLAVGDTAGARAALLRARDLDVVRFRAPSSFNDVIKRVAAEDGARYVPLDEAFAGASPGGMTGRGLFLEHVHPTRDGVVLIARTLYEALRDAHFLGRQAREESLRPWSDYRDRMALSPFDERIAAHTVASVQARWPFVAAAQQRDYRGTYRPRDATDSLALLVSRGGMAWEPAKILLSERLSAAGSYEAAANEARGLVRDAPLQAVPFELMGRALFALRRDAEADSALRRAWSLGPTVSAGYAIGLLALRRQQVREGIRWLELALRLDPTNAAAMYQLSLAYALSGDAERARATAMALAIRDPRFPGLDEWLQRLGLPLPH